MEEVEAKDEKFARSLLEMAGELGLNGTDIPEEFGGEGMDKNMHQPGNGSHGRSSFVCGFPLSPYGIGTLPIVYFGTEEQKKKYLPKLATGEWFAAYCLTEPNAGSDALNAQTNRCIVRRRKALHHQW